MVVKFAQTTMMQHDEHRKAFQAQTKTLGGKAQTKPNGLGHSSISFPRARWTVQDQVDWIASYSLVNQISGGVQHLIGP